MAAIFFPPTGISEVAQTAAFNVTAGSFYTVSGSSNVTATLPSAVGITNQVARIRCANGYTGLLTIATNGGQTIGPAAATTQVILKGETALVQSDGANWVRTGGLIIPCICKMSITAATTLVAYATDTQVLLNNVDYDTTGQMGSTSGHTITIIRPGIYRLSARVFWGASSTPGYNFYTLINKNGSNQVIYTQMAYGPFTLNNYTETVETFGKSALLAGDALQLNIFQQGSNGSGNLNFLGGTSGAAITYMEVEEIPSW